MEIEATMASVPYKWECLWVDDGSSDGTLALLRRMRNDDSRHKYISLTQNFGQAAALYTGFRYARGDILATLDGDGQNNPRDLPVLVERLLKSDLHMINGIRHKRKDSLTKKVSSRIANAFRNWLTREQITDVGCALRVFRRSCVNNIPYFHGMHRFLPTLIRTSGFDRIEETPVSHRNRWRGRSKYGINNRFWRGLIDTFAVRWMQSRMKFPEVRETWKT
jgi:glycosyltransferase involved in cell wall biosynthesis